MFSFKKKRFLKADFSSISFGETTGIVISIFFIVFFLKNPGISLINVKKGMDICASAIIPNIFPFMVASEILVRSNGGVCLGKLSEKIMNFMFGLSGEAGCAFVLGVVCGFPIGTKTAIGLYKQGRISKQETEKIISICNNPSPAFLINVVGSGLWSNQKIGVLLFISVLLSGIICGIFQRKRNSPTNNAKIIKKTTREPFLKVFSESISSSALSMLMVCSYIIFFSCVVGCLSFFTDKALISDSFKSILFSFFELTAGTYSVSLIRPKKLGLIICASALGWSGLSVHMQNTSICTYQSGDKISMKRYYISKLFQSILSPIIITVLILFIPIDIKQNYDNINVFLLFNSKIRLFTVVFFIISSFYTILKAILLLSAKINRQK